MKTKFKILMNNYLDIVIVSITTFVCFMVSYFLEITLENYEQFIAVVIIIMLDGYFGMIAGIKREGFKTYKAIKILRTNVTWIIILSALLAVEKGFTGMGWLSETVMIPFIVFQLLSALKNASMSGYIKHDVLNNILDKFDKHKGVRQ